MLFSPHISTKEQSYIFKRLSFLIKAGIPLEQSINILGNQARSKRHKLIYRAIERDIAHGLYLSESLRRQGNMFSQSTIHIVRIGEEVGSLSDNLAYLSEELHKKIVLKQKIISALLYPAFIALGTIALSFFLIVFIFPKIRPMFISLKATLPPTTRMLIVISSVVQKFGLIISLLVILLIITITLAVRLNKTIHYYKDSILLSVPLVGNIIRMYALATLLRTIGIILKAGLPVQEALGITSETTGNSLYRYKLVSISKSVASGGSISEGMANCPKIFPPLVGAMTNVAEATGMLSETMLYLSDIYEYEVDEAAKNLSSLLEPLLMVTMGFIVGFIALSIITPIYSLTQTISH